MPENGTKPGYKTTEFWMTVVADILGLITLSGVVVEGTTMSTIVGGAIIVLSTLGYDAARSKAKTGG